MLAPCAAAAATGAARVAGLELCCCCCSNGGAGQAAASAVASAAGLAARCCCAVCWREGCPSACSERQRARFWYSPRLRSGPTDTGVPASRQLLLKSVSARSGGRRAWMASRPPRVRQTRLTSTRAMCVRRCARSQLVSRLWAAGQESSGTGAAEASAVCSPTTAASTAAGRPGCAPHCRGPPGGAARGLLPIWPAPSLGARFRAVQRPQATIAVLCRPIEAIMATISAMSQVICAS